MSVDRAAAALSAALAAEEAAIYGYGVAGAHLAGARQAAARRAWAQHEAARDALAALVTGAGGRPPAPAVTYQLPFPVRDARSALALAVFCEDRLATAYLGVVALPTRRLRAVGAAGVRDAALRAASWRGTTVAFPGLVN